MLSKRMQMKIIRELYDGHDPRVDPTELDDPWYGCYLLMSEVPPYERRAAFAEYCTTELHDYQVYRQIKDFVDREPQPKDIPSFADLAETLPPIDWLWKDWIPNGLLSCLAAPTGAGKSLIALDLARRVVGARSCASGLRGQAPDGHPLRPRSNTVVYVDAENVPQINVNRARSWSMPLDQLYSVLPAPYTFLDLCRSADQDRMIETVHAVQPGLVVVDSLGHLSSRGINAIEEVRPVLIFLAALADDADCAVLLIHHTRKRSAAAPPGPMTPDDLVGSTYIVAGCRVVIGVSVIQTGPQPDRNGPRRVEVLKTNLARFPDPLGCDIGREIDGAVAVRYSDAPQPYHEPTTVDLCADWLLEVLREASQPLPPRDLVTMAGAESFSRATLYRARERLGSAIVNTDNPRHPDNKWALPDNPPPGGSKG